MVSQGILEGSYHFPQLDDYILANAAQYVAGLFCCTGSLVTQLQESRFRRNTYPFQVESSGVLSDPMCVVEGANSREGKGIFSQDSQQSDKQTTATKHLR